MVIDLSKLSIGTLVVADDIAKLSGQNRVKGIHPLSTGEVAILCTINGMNYPNIWLDKEKKRLKYYLEGRENRETGIKEFYPDYKSNQAVIKSSEGSIHVFARERRREKYRYEGQFSLDNLVEDETGMYFILKSFTHEEGEEELLFSFTRINEEVSTIEGRKVYKTHAVRERDPHIIKKAIQRAKQLRGKLECEVCGFNFEEVYGQRGEGFIEGHHIKPLSEKDDHGSITRIEDIALVCSNCHRMIHRSYPWLSIEELKDMISKCSNKDIIV